ncbi:MAG TPA: hypothetical protein VGK59_15405 [Ohtaekwangia sp.]
MKTLLLLGLIMTLFSCHHETEPILKGKYVEVSPQAGRSQLEFSSSRVIRTEPGSSGSDVFRYEIEEGMITLTPAWDNSPATKMEIEITNRSEFVIENLYPGIPEATHSYMTFRKK